MFCPRLILANANLRTKGQADFRIRGELLSLAMVFRIDVDGLTRCNRIEIWTAPSLKRHLSNSLPSELQARAQRLAAEYLRMWGLRDPQAIADRSRIWVDQCDDSPVGGADELPLAEVYRTVMQRATSDMDGWLDHLALAAGIDAVDSASRRGLLAMEVQSLIDENPAALLEQEAAPARLIAATARRRPCGRSQNVADAHAHSVARRASRCLAAGLVGAGDRRHGGNGWAANIAGKAVIGAARGCPEFGLVSAARSSRDVDDIHHGLRRLDI